MHFNRLNSAHFSSPWMFSVCICVCFVLFIWEGDRIRCEWERPGTCLSQQRGQHSDLRRLAFATDTWRKLKDFCLPFQSCGNFRMYAVRSYCIWSIYFLVEFWEREDSIWLHVVSSFARVCWTQASLVSCWPAFTLSLLWFSFNVFLCGNGLSLRKLCQCIPF